MSCLILSISVISHNPPSTQIHQQLLLEACSCQKTWQITKQMPNKKKVHSLKPTNHPKNRPVAPKEERIVSQPPWLSWAKMLVIRTYKSVIEDHLFLTPHVICTRVKTPHISLVDKLIPPWKIRESLCNGQFLNPLKSLGFLSSSLTTRGTHLRLKNAASLRSLLLPLVDDAPLALPPAKGLDFDGGC